MDNASASRALIASQRLLIRFAVALSELSWQYWKGWKCVICAYGCKVIFEQSLSACDYYHFARRLSCAR